MKRKNRPYNALLRINRKIPKFELWRLFRAILKRVESQTDSDGLNLSKASPFSLSEIVQGI